MTWVTVYGTGKKVWVELHPPVGDEPNLADIANYEQVSPETFAERSGNPKSPGAFGVVLSTNSIYGQTAWAKQSALARMKNQAAAYQKALRNIGRKRGRPQSLHFTLAEDFAILVLYFEARGFRQPRAKARKFWDKLDFPVSERLVKAALRKVRGWQIPDLDAVARITCRANGLADPPLDRPRRRRR